MTTVAFQPVPQPPAPQDQYGRNGRLTGLQLLLGFVSLIIAEGAVFATDGLWRALVDTGQNTVWMGGTTVHPVGIVVGSLVGSAVAIVGHLLIVGPLGKRRGLAMRGPGILAEFAVGLVIGAALVSVSTGIIALLGGYRVTSLEPNPQVLVPLAIGIFPAFCEEIFFRGALLRLLDGWLGSWAAIIISSLVFGLVHITNPDAQLWGAVAITIEAGLLLSGAYLLTRRLWLAIGIHLTWNFVQSGVFSFAVSGTGEQRGLLQAEQSGPDWLSGGAMGVEGSVVTVAVGLLAGIVMLVMAHRRGNIWPRDRRRRPEPEPGYVVRSTN